MNERKKEPPMFVAVRFARLRDRSIGQKNEVDALLDIMNETDKFMRMANDALFDLIKGRKSKSHQHIQQTTFIIITNIQDNLAKFFDAKTYRIQRLLDYFLLDERNVPEEAQRFREFEALWDDLKKEYDRIKHEFMSRSLSDYSLDSMEEIQVFQDLIAKKALPLMKRLKELEDKLQQDVIIHLTAFTKTNMVMDSNELYKLLTDEP